ncbi:hypothetical protein FIBSPDRAFT_912289 [Athelia psychrophila]|uniref:Uncharacterized protein n=1 Tax=Athelia psychrophila TaxID=1759441 RepID=A0A166F4E4_9AGAM|nr:hypothetical protein FIBSPDRAFT_912289 [Fibularhizoctonia sp. CBS 109695]
MMERGDGGFAWSHSHNSPFELSKLACMDFPRRLSQPASSPLTLLKPNPDGTITTQVVNAVTSYKYLGVFFDPNLSFKYHAEKAVSKATCKNSGGMPPSRIKQLWNTVAVPAFTYAADVNMRGSRKATKHITGALSLTAADTMEVHAHILPIDLLAAARICTLPAAHPLHAISRRAASRFVKRHRSPLHYLFHLTGLRPATTETVNPTRRRHNYIVPHSTHIEASKGEALIKAQAVNDSAQVRGGIGAAAVMYEGSRVIASTEYTVHNGEAVGVIMGLDLLISFTRRLRGPTIIGCLTNQKPHTGHYLLDIIHDLEERLHAKQDGLARHAERAIARRNNDVWTPKRKGVVDLQFHWVPGHKDFAPNERADREAKSAAKKLSSAAKDLPACLRKEALPISVAALRQEHTAKLKRRWTKRWRRSPRSRHFGTIDKSAPSTKFLKLINSYSRKQSSIITQFRTNHVPLNQTLFRIGRVESPACTIKLGRKAGEIPFLLSDSSGVKEFLRYVHTTKRFKQ